MDPKEALESLLGLSAGDEESLADFQVFDLPGDGPRVRALWAVPRRAGKVPAVVLNHGGFDGFTASFLHAARQWLAAGWAVAASEYRGEGSSSGRADYAGGEVDDVLRLARWVEEQPEIAEGRVGMVGYSRGGTVALLAAAEKAPVAAVAVFSPVTDIERMLQVSERAGQILDRQDLAFDFQDPEEVRRRSPIHRVGEMKVPLLLLHGEKDPLVPADQSVRFAEAVRAAGGRVELRLFPEAPHHLKAWPGAFETARAFLEARVGGPPPPLEGDEADRVAEIRARPSGRLDEARTLLEARDLPVPPEDPYAGVAHGGIYQRMSWVDMTKRPRANLNHPLLAGIDFNAPWAILEPEEDTYDWSWVDEPLEIWGAAGKRCGINVVTLQPRGKSDHAGHATPEWVFEKGAKKVTVETRGKGRTVDMVADYQLFWDPIYLESYEDFVRDFAARYDGDPRIDVIGIGVAKLGGLTVIDPKISDVERRQLLGFYESHGYTPDKWFQTIQRFGLMYRRHFKKTPVRFNLSNFFDKEDVSRDNLEWFEKVSSWAADNGIGLIYQGISGGEHYVRKMRNKPIDEIFARHADRIFTGAEPVDPIYQRRGDFMGTIEENVDHALGLAPGLRPTRIVWLNFYMKDCSASNPLSRQFDPRWWRAFHRAWENLRLVPLPAPSPPATSTDSRRSFREEP